MHLGPQNSVAIRDRMTDPNKDPADTFFAMLPFTYLDLGGDQESFLMEEPLPSLRIGGLLLGREVHTPTSTGSVVAEFASHHLSSSPYLPSSPWWVQQPDGWDAFSGTRLARRGGYSGTNHRLPRWYPEDHDYWSDSSEDAWSAATDDCSAEDAEWSTED